MNQRLFGTIFIMLISPFAGLISALRNGSDKSSSYLRWSLIIFITLYGSMFSIDGKIGDGVRHWQNVYSYYPDLTFHQFWLDTEDIIYFRTNDYVQEDLYIHVLSYLVGNIIHLPGLFFTVVAFVYGYFFSGSMVRLFKVFPSFNKSVTIFILALLFIALLNIQSMNTVRTWTGFWVLFYACISYYQTGKGKYLFLLFVPPFIHIGFFIMVIPTLLVVFLPYKKWFIIGAYILSFVTNFIEPPAAFKELSVFEVGQEKTDAYGVEEKTSIEGRITLYGEKRWYKQYEKSGIVSWCLVGITLAMLLSGIYTEQMNRIESNLFTIGLVTKILANSTWFLFALTNRSDIISMHFILAGIILFWQRQWLVGHSIKLNVISNSVMKLSLIGILPYFVYVISETLQYLSIYILAFPYVVWIRSDLNVSFRDVLSYFM